MSGILLFEGELSLQLHNHKKIAYEKNFKERKRTLLYASINHFKVLRYYFIFTLVESFRT